MSCTGRYAEAYEYANFWYNDVIWSALDRSGAVGNAFLTDDQVNFIDIGCVVGEGHQVTNLTDSLTDYITAVENHRLYADGMVFDNGDSYRVSLLTLVQRDSIEVALDLAAGDIHSSLMSVDACSCTLSTGGLDYLKKLNTIIAAAYYHTNCGNPRFTDEMRNSYLEFGNSQLALIRNGTIELCNGYTGGDWPAMGWANQSVTEFAAARIVLDDIIANS